MQSPQLSLNELSPSTTQFSPAGSPSLQPTPTTIPRPKGKSVFCSPRALAAHLAVAVLVAVLALLLWAIYGRDWKPKSAVVQTTKPCCVPEVQELYYHVNFSISPCRSLYDHVCGQYARTPEPLAFKDFNYYSVKDFYTAPNTTIGKALHTFFQSCVSAMANVDGQGSPTVATYLDVLRPKIAELKAKHEILVFLLRMTVKYNIQPVPTLALYGRGGFPLKFYIYRLTELRKPGILAIILPKTRPQIEDVIAGRYERMRRDCLKTINERMNLNVTLEAMESLERELDMQDDSKYIVSNFSLVAHLVKSLTVDDWRRIVLNVSDANVPENFYHGNMELLSKAFSIVLDGTRQPDTIVFFIFKAASEFLREHLKASTANTRAYFSFCQRILDEYSLMRVVSAVKENSKSPEHDASFRNMFTEIVTAIGRRAKSIFSKEDEPRLSSYLRSLRILLPSDIHPLNKWIPPLTSDYVRNRIDLFTSDWSIWTHQPPPGITERMSAAVTTGKISAFDDSVIIPINAYSVLYFGNGTERLVFLSVAGVQLADVVWGQIFHFGRNWSRATSKLLRRYKSCQKELGVLLTNRWKHFSLPLLSIETAMELAKDSHWLRSFQAVPLWSTSRCQLFYLLFVYHHYCPGNDPEKPALAKEAQYIASTSEDFRAAFKCLRPKVPVRTCTLNALS